MRRFIQIHNVAEALESRRLLSVANIVNASDLDPAFGQAGRAVTAFEGSVALGRVLALPGGQMLVQEQHLLSGTQTPVTGLVRVNPDGTVDPTFGSNGFVEVTFDSTIGGSRAMAVTPDGHILLAGSSRDGAVQTLEGRDDFTLRRLNPDGSPDTTFGTGGRVITDVAQRQDLAFGVLAQPDGRYVVFGYEQREFLSRVEQTPRVALVRYEADGRLDATFGNGGKVVVEVPGFEANRASSALLQDDGKIVVVGNVVRDFAERGDPPQVMAMRFNADGSPDRSFGGDGVVVTKGSGDASDVALAPNGSILVAGQRFKGRSGEANFTVMRVKADGGIDRAFGRAGTAAVPFRRQLDLPVETGNATAVAVQPDGSVVATGHASLGHAVLVRLLANGRPDRDFGPPVVTEVPAAGTDRVTTILLPADGKIVTSVAGSSDVLTRYQGVTVKPFAFLGNRTLRVAGTDGPDDILVTHTPQAFRTLSVFRGGYEQRFADVDVDRIVIDARGGDDVVSTDDLLIRADIKAGAGNDTVTGSSAADRIIGGPGDDTLFARDGEADAVVGGPGTDDAQVDDALDKVSGIESILP